MLRFLEELYVLIAIAVRRTPARAAAGCRIHSSTARLTCTANRSTSREVAPPRLTMASGCFVDSPTLRSPWPLRDAGALDEPRGRYFHPPSGRGKAWNSVAGEVRDAIAIRDRDDGIHEERSDAARIRIVSIEHHALATPDRENGVAHVTGSPGCRFRDAQFGRRGPDMSGWAWTESAETSRRTRRSGRHRRT